MNLSQQSTGAPKTLKPYSYTIENTGVVVQPTNWVPSAPTNEPQSGGFGLDKNVCATQSNCQGLETDLIAQIAASQLPVTHLSFLKANKYLDENGRPRFNVRVSAILNGTTKNGNDCDVVASATRSIGLFPFGIIPDDPTLSWNDYYNKAVITPEILALGLEFLKYFTPYYIWVWTSGGARTSAENAALLSAIAAAPLQLPVPVCPTWNSPNVLSCPSLVVQHAVLGQKVGADFSITIQDHYVPYEKVLAPDYPIPYALQVFLRPNDLNTFHHTFNVNLTYESSLNPSVEVIALQQALFMAGLFYDSSMPTLAAIQEFGGYFGNATLAAVKAFQGKHGVPETGFVGPLTRAQLNKIYS